jgi:transcriptional regulator with XRE-family HTH domain
MGTTGNLKAKRMGAVLREWRVEKGWTLQDVSDRTAAPGPRVDFSQLSKMERGLAEPQLDVYERVAVALGRTLSALLARSFPVRGRRPAPRRVVARNVSNQRPRQPAHQRPSHVLHGDTVPEPKGRA